MIFVTLSHYPDLFHDLVASLDTHEPLVPRLLIQDGSLIHQTPPNWEVIRVMADKFNYSRNVNIAWRHAGDNDVILCGDDVRFTGPFIQALRQTAYSDERVGVACAQLWGQSPFVCGYFKREVLDSVGEMDERFDGYGEEDMDWCRRMEALGYRTQPVEVPATHTGGTSFFRREAEGGERVQDGSDRARRTFAEKWG